MNDDEAVRGFDALTLPPAAMAQGGVEILRAALIDGGLHVSLRRVFDDPEAWGLLLADFARHAARIFATEKDIPENATVDRIRAIFDAELDAPSDGAGSTTAIS